MAEYDIPYTFCGTKLDLKDECPKHYVTNDTAKIKLSEIKNRKDFFQYSALEEIYKNIEYIGATKKIFSSAISKAITFSNRNLHRTSQLVCNCTLL